MACVNVCVSAAAAALMDQLVFSPPIPAAAPPLSNTANDSKFN